MTITLHSATENTVEVQFEQSHTEYDAFEALARRLVNVPKSKVDEARAAEKRAGR